MIKLFRLCNSNIWVKLFKLDQTWGTIQMQNAMLRDLVKRSNIKFIDPTRCCMQMFIYIANEFLVSKETVVLRRWERSKQKFGFIKRVDKG